MTKVLHINDYPMEAGGGAEVVMRTTLDLLQGRGILVDTFTSADLGDPRCTAWRYVSNSHACAALEAKLRQFQPDVVHLHNYYHVLSPGILSTIADFKRSIPVRVVMTAHDYHLICPNSGGSWFRWWTGQRELIDASVGNNLWLRQWDQRSVLHSGLKLAQHLWNYRWNDRRRVIDVLICPSRFVETMLGRLEIPTRWLPHPVPTSVGRAGGQARPPKLRFVFAGRVEPEKGLRELLEMWPTDANLTVIGAGAEVEACRAICVARGIADRVDFTGRLPHAETLARIAQCHVLVQPSRVLETYGLTLIEALGCGTNILAANRGAAREIVEASGVGFLYELDSVHSLLSQLTAIRQQHDVGTLNHFDIAPFLADRAEARYVEELFAIYGIAAATPLAA